jgi:tRNA (cmo5U34)-methyltransferase
MSEGWNPEAYASEIRAEISRYDELQARVVEATRGGRVRTVLELGVGTGETARRILALHPAATLVGIDANEAMLAAAREALPADRAFVRLARLEDPLPEGAFDLVVSVLAVHHLRGDGKAELFGRIAGALEPAGRFVLGDVVVPERPEDAVIPVEEGFDFPDRLDAQLRWLDEAGFSAETVWMEQDLAVVRAELQPPV